MQKSVRDSEEVGITFKRASDERIEIIDLIEKKRCHLSISPTVEFDPTDPDRFVFPVEESVSVQTSFLVVHEANHTFVRDSEGQVITEVVKQGNLSFPRDDYVLEFSGPLKCYLEFSDSFGLKIESSSVRIDFPSQVIVRLGARSHHQRPAGVIYTSEDPLELMTAISFFGSALKTLTPERSFPTLRGYPPKIELGDQFTQQTFLEPPDIDVKLASRPIYEDIFSLAPLAYYLGAKVIPGDRPTVLVNGESLVDLTTFDTIFSGVEKVLRHVFALDCITRTVGLYPVELGEYQRLGAATKFNRAEAYSAPIEERLERYFEIPFDDVSDVISRWPVYAHVDASPDSVPTLPHLVYRLALISVYREVDDHHVLADRYSDHQYSSTDKTASGLEVDFKSSVVLSKAIESESTTEHLWVGPGYVEGCSKVLREGYEHALSRKPSDNPITIRVICNDDKFLRETKSLSSVYNSEDDSNFDILLREGLSRDELESELSKRTDFLHYIGHIHDESFLCSDGKLSPSDVDSIGVTTFLLNSCNSYKVGHALVEGGAIGGIVTLADVVDNSAAWMGINIGKLLNSGYHLQSALAILKPETILGGEYLIVGDGRATLTHSGTIPSIVEIELSESQYDFSSSTFTTNRVRVGGLTQPMLSNNSRYSLVSNESDRFNPTKEEILEFLSIDQMPIRINGEMYWSQDVHRLDIITREE